MLGRGAGFRARPGPSKRRTSWLGEKLWDQRYVSGEFQLLQVVDCDFSFAPIQETFLKVQENMHFFLRLCRQDGGFGPWLVWGESRLSCGLPQLGSALKQIVSMVLPMPGL